MNLLLDVMIPGDPVGKGRPRCTCRGGKPRMYTPEMTREWETHAAEWMAIHYGGEPIRGAVRVHIVVVRRRPKNAKRSLERTYSAKKPDLDNVQKAVHDALQIAQVLSDDNQIASAKGEKMDGATGEEPCVHVRVWGL